VVYFDFGFAVVSMVLETRRDHVDNIFDIEMSMKSILYFRCLLPGY